jgi:hypothetical protein
MENNCYVKAITIDNSHILLNHSLLGSSGLKVLFLPDFSDEGVERILFIKDESRPPGCPVAPTPPTAP